MENYVDNELIKVSLGKESADLVIKNGKIVDVFLHRIIPGGVAVKNGRIAAIGDVDYCIGENTEVVDVGEKYLVPGLIDSHVHPEASKLFITRFAEACLKCGVTSLCCCFDHAALVAGIPAVRFMLETSEKLPVKTFFHTPSRLPYTTPASTIRCNFGEEEHRETLEWDDVSGIWEFMIESIQLNEKAVIDAGNRLIETHRLPQGHLPFCYGPNLQAAAGAGVRTCHENFMPQDALLKAREGIHVLLRNSLGANDAHNDLRTYTEGGLTTRYLSLCSDDVDCHELVKYGYMDYYLRCAIRQGVDPITAVQMCTINPAIAYQKDHIVGSIAPGRYADIIMVNTLDDFDIQTVYANGQRVYDRASDYLVRFEDPEIPEFMTGSMHRDREITAEDIYLKVPAEAKEADVSVMQLLPIQIRIVRKETLKAENGHVMPDPSKDAVYISVTDRHSGRTTTSSTIIGGFGLKEGAFATSLSPDDDNIICIGANVEDMAVAINHLFDIDGGWVVVRDGKVIGDLQLPIAGVETLEPYDVVGAKEFELIQHLFDMGVNIPNPFFSILFLSITAIPECSITDKGFVSYATKDYIQPVEAWR